MPVPYQGQSVAKTIFLLSSAVGWLIVGASLIYLVPTAIDRISPSPTSQIWMETLGRSGYNPQLAIVAGGIAFVVTVAGNAFWYYKFEGKF
ncbi:hypothetical protein S7335_1598 [Synechococcus sp. PCC 7335]|uniref:hypothetical protein n=1 Tax=Synechococcus sp. (strain ATCC 29403 / PCC 7335) TaxID=91464 RepID=UPI00017EBBEE|nr:hypothetical protein [Synechococcus sp. PCC 7335]EDX83901.1 hypothetical protein S7335_1598 [Synechococcus sp. PCC 7335]